jgi:hypothetical protein
MRTVRFAAAIAVALGIPAAAGAQDTPKAGIVIAYPTAVGILWHVTDKIAIRPEFNIQGSSTETTAAQFSTDSSGWAAGFGLSALFYMRTEDSLRTYIVPRFSYLHSSNSSKGPTGVSVDVGSDSYGGSGAFGAQYTLGKRFALFGELGVGFDHHTSDTFNGTKSKGSTWGLQSGVGVVFYP